MLYYNQLKKTSKENYMWPHNALNFFKKVKKKMIKIPVLWKLTHIYLYIFIDIYIPTAYSLVRLHSDDICTIWSDSCRSLLQ